MSNIKPKSGTVERESMEGCKNLVADFVRWLRSRGFSERSRESYPQNLNLFFRFLESEKIIYEESLDVTRIDTQVIADYQAFLFEYISPKTERKLKADSQLTMLCMLVTFCRFLKATHRVTADPSRNIRLPRQTQSLPAALLTPVEVRRLLALPNTQTVLGFRDRAILEVFWCCGLRITELLSLTVADVNFTEGLLTIRQGKGGKDRVIPLGTTVLSWLREYIDKVRPLLAKQADHRPRTTDHRPIKTNCRLSTMDCGRLFLSRRGQRLDKSGLLKKLKVYQQRGHIRKSLTGHSFRHTLATEMLKRGADLRHIQELLGHEKLTTTQRYTHIVKAELKKVHGKTHPREQTPFASIGYLSAARQAGRGARS